MFVINCHKQQDCQNEQHHSSKDVGEDTVATNEAQDSEDNLDYADDPVFQCAKSFLECNGEDSTLRNSAFSPSLVIFFLTFRQLNRVCVT